METIKREQYEIDIVLVGGGIANLSTAVRLMQRIDAHNKAVESGESKEQKLELPTVMIIEKSLKVGSHILSGAVVDPVALKELFPNFLELDCPLEDQVKSDPFYFLTSKMAVRVPMVPPVMRSKGAYIVSLEKLTQWFVKQAEALGAEMYTGFAASTLLKDGSRITGVRLGDKGLGKEGEPLSNVMYGDEILAKVVVLGEGVHGVVTKQAIKDLNLGEDINPPANVLGIKEIIQLPKKHGFEGKAMHTFGYPHNGKTYGGGFFYGRPDNQIALGLATGLNYQDPRMDMHELFVQWKSHPFINKIIAGGEVVEYGAKCIPEGGFFAVPKMVADGLMILGDSAGLLNSVKIKGIHLAMKSGICAGDTLFSCWKSGSFSAEQLEEYPKSFMNSWAGKELKKVRNIHQCFEHGRMTGMAGLVFNTVSFGLLPPGRMRNERDNDTLKPVQKYKKEKKPFTYKPDKLMQDRLSDVFLSGTEHREDQPSHIRIPDPKICVEQCGPKYNYPCTRFCPAEVYEWMEEDKRIQVNFTNCLHCQTCESKDPFDNIEWNLPEAEGGPRYKSM
ncbi:electron transfer flavoprotein-ubiquinone oxidoreductase [bacterium]|nr:electron transfer flavoprotein-ubiquinone oxidoreductase [bacterium]